MKIRTPNEDLEAYHRKYGRGLPKIRAVEGSRIVPVVYHDSENQGGACALMESALDAALIYQQTDGLVSAIGLNGASQHIDGYADKILKAARPLIIIPDIDNGVGEQTGKKLEGIYWPYGVQCAVPYGKDPCEAQRRAFERDTFYGFTGDFKKTHTKFPTISCWIFEQSLPFAIEEIQKRRQNIDMYTKQKDR